MLHVLHKTIKKVSRDTDRLEFNTAIAQMMIFLNEISGMTSMPRKLWTPFVLLLAPYAPHLAEELWEKLGHAPSISRVPWPEWIEALTAEELVEVVFQVNGKIRARENLPPGTADAELEEKALANQKIREILAGKVIRKVIVVPNKLVNIVAAL
jgi:leucyl-tRNA synthetase